MKFHTNCNALASSSCLSSICIGIRCFMVMISIHLVHLSPFVDAQAPPSNDLCINAQSLTIGSSSIPITFNTTYATTDLDLADDCFFSYYDRAGGPGIWFTFIGTGERIVGRACDLSLYYTKISVFTGRCEPSAIQCVAATNNGCQQEQFLFDSTRGTNYFVLVQTENALATTTVDVSIFAAPAPPSNDLCINAQPLTIGSSSVPVKFNVTYATTDLDVADDCVSGGPPTFQGIWFKFTGTGGRIVVRACTSDDDTLVSVFTGGCGPSTLQCVVASGNTCNQEKFIVETTLGTNYFLLVQTLYNYFDTVDVSIFEAPDPPSNDFCINAQPLTIGSSYVPIKFTTTFATTDSDVASDCLNGNRISPPRNPGIWFKFTGTGGRIAIKACGDSRFNTYISVFSGGCGPSTLQCSEGIYNSCQKEALIYENTLGTIYFVLVQTSYGVYDTVDVSIFEAPGPPSNDLCINAQPLTIGSAYVPVKFNIAYATIDLDVANDCISGRPRNPGIWFKFTGTGGRIAVRACGDSRYDTYISVFSGGCGPSALQCVAATDNSCQRGRLSFDTTLGTNYFVLVQGNDNFKTVDVSIFEAPDPYSNDLCINAQPLTIGSSSIPVKLNTTFATTDLDVANDCLSSRPPSNPGIWFKFTGTGGRITIKACGDSRFDTYISVFGGGCGPSTLQCVVATYAGCERELFVFENTLGTIYFVLVQSSYDDYDTVDVSIFEAPDPPSNDLCINAQPLTIGSAYVPVKFNIAYATTDLDVANACLSGGRPSNPGIWFKFTGTGGRIAVRACGDSRYDTYISVFSGGCGPSALQCVAATYSSCQRGRLSFETTLGTNYFVLVQANNNFETVDVSIFSAPPPSNDKCINAQPLTIGSSSIPVKFNTTYASTDLDVANDCFKGNRPPSNPGIWFKFTGTGGRIAVRACEGDGTNDGTKISVYTGGCGPSALQCVAATDNACQQGQFSLETTLGTNYFVLVQMEFYLKTVDVFMFTASAPSNDKCINAQPLTIGSSSVTLKFNTSYASTDLDVASDCLNGNPPESPGIWFKFVGTGERIALGACELFLQETKISIYTGGCGPTALQCVAASYDSCQQRQGRFYVENTLGKNYFVLVQTYYFKTVYLSIYVPVAPVSPTKRPSTMPTRRPTTSKPTAINVNVTTPTVTPTLAPTTPPCGLFRRSIFCPLKFRGILGRFIRGIFG